METKAEEIKNDIEAMETSLKRRVSDIPIVSNTVALVNDNYKKIKSKNKIIEIFVNGVEIGFLRVTGTAFSISKSFLPYDYMGKLACDGIDKVEHYFPFVKKTPPTTYEELKRQVYSLISGVEDEAKLPSHLVGALMTRMSSTMSYAYNVPRFAIEGVFLSISNKMLSTLDGIIEYVLPPTKEEEIIEAEDELMNKIKQLASKLKRRIMDAAAYVGKSKKKHDTNLTIDIMNVIEHGLSNISKNLEKFEPKGPLIKLLRLSALSISGLVLSITGTMNKAVSTPQVHILITKCQNIVHATFKLVHVLVENVYSTARKQTNVAINFMNQQILSHIWKVAISTHPSKSFVFQQSTTELHNREIEDKTSKPDTDNSKGSTNAHMVGAE